MSSRTPQRRSGRTSNQATPTSERSTRSRRRNDNEEEKSSTPLRPMPDMDTSRDDPGSAKKARADSRAGSKSPGSMFSAALSTSRPGSAYSTRNAPGRTPTRADINSDSRHHRQFRMDPGDAEAMDFQDGGGERAAQQDDEQKIYVWGTRICVTDVNTQFTKFLKEYKEQRPDDDEIMIQTDNANAEQIDPNEPFYMQRLAEMATTLEPHLNLNLQHVRNFDERLYRSIICYPAEILPYLDKAANTLFESEHDIDELDAEIQIRPFNAEKTRNMRGLNPEDIDQLITVTGMVIRTSPLIPEMRIGHFECTICKNELEVGVDRGRIEEPTVCTNCNNNHCFTLIHNRSQFNDKQIVKLQESPDDMPAGQTPHAVTLYAHGNLIDTVHAGDRVTVTGIYRALPLRVNPRQRSVKSVYRTHIDVVHFRRKDDQRLHLENDGSYLTEERVEQIKELASRNDVCELLANALAPSIYEHDDIKKGILCLLFGGTPKNFSKAGGGHFRSEINMLLCGDPGTSKSQLLQYVHNLVPRGQYTSGKGSSAVGLTAYVSRDPETKHFVLQTGALVLSDNGVCCIDEFDKMNESTRAVLHEVMEQQTLSITKAGIICQLHARTSILAAANPVDSEWNKDKTIVENVQLPPTLLSRFDLIFLLVDPQDELYDRRLATHLVSLYYKNKEDQKNETMDMALMRDYIQYAKANVHPKISEEASSRLIAKYMDMRKMGGGPKNNKHVTAYPRQLESLIRLSEANAKIRLRETVTLEDVEEAYRLHREALKQAAVDPKTGRVDVNIISAGISDTTRKHMLELAEVIKARLSGKSAGTMFNLMRVLHDMRESSDQKISKDLFDNAINELCRNDVIVRIGDKVRLVQTTAAAGKRNAESAEL